MADFIIAKDSTSVILPVSIYDSSSTIGAKLAGLTFETASLTGYYNRMGAAGAATAISLATATKGTWATGGFVAIDGTNMPGDYELHIPNAALVTGADFVAVQLKGAANMVPVNILIQLISATAGFSGTDQAAIKTKTDSLTFTVAGDVDVNVQTWAGTAVATPTTGGVPEVDVTYFRGIAVPENPF